MTKRLKAKKPSKPFYTQIDPSTIPAVNPTGSREALPHVADWVERERIDFIALRPHLQGLADDLEPGMRVVTAGTRVQEKRAEGLLSLEAFFDRIRTPEQGGGKPSIRQRSLVDVLKDAGALADWDDRAADPPKGIHPSEVFDLYNQFRDDGAVSTITEFQAVDKIDDLEKIRKSCLKLAQNFRKIAPLFDSVGDGHEIPDSLREHVRRAAGQSAEAHGWLETFARWLQEAAFVIESSRKDGDDRRRRFMLAWDKLATERTGHIPSERARNEVRFEVGRRLFRITFPGASYKTVKDYRDRVRDLMNP